MKRRRTGFTLLELLVVIAILTMLIGILLPSLSASRRHAKANACLSALKNIGTAFSIYLNENRDQFPPVRMEKPSPTSTEDYVNEYNRAKPRWQWFLKTEYGPVIDPKPFRRLKRPFEDDDLGHRLTIYCEDKGDLYQKITRVFCKDGCVMRMATLEDVFLKLTGRRLRQ